MSLPGRWRWRDRPIFRKARFGHCVCNIDPPASPYAIMRRAYPYRGENRGPGKDDRGELDIRSRNSRTKSARIGLTEMVCYYKCPLSGPKRPSIGQNAEE